MKKVDMPDSVKVTPTELPKSKVNKPAVPVKKVEPVVKVEPKKVEPVVKKVEPKKVTYNSWMKSTGDSLVSKGFSQKTILARALKAVGKELTSEISKMRDMETQLKFIFK